MSKLHLVFGGRVADPRGLDFRILGAIDMVGMFDDYADAEEAWRAPRSAPWTMPRCTMSSSISTACSSPKTRRRRNRHEHGRSAFDHQWVTCALTGFAALGGKRTLSRKATAPADAPNMPLKSNMRLPVTQLMMTARSVMICLVKSSSRRTVIGCSPSSVG